MSLISIRNREVRLVKRTAGMPQSENFMIVKTDLRPCADDEVLVRNRWFRVSISTRLMMSEAAEVVKGIPFPPLRIGDTLADGAIGEVISAPDTSGFKPGDLVSHSLGWREYAYVPQGKCTAIAEDEVDPAAYLGHGWTAYAALTRGVQIRSGDTVFVSSGAGSIGSMAGQIARKLGAGRIIGSTSSAEKAQWMREALGYDAVIIRGQGPITSQLAAAAADGIDVFVDIVGGEQLEAAASAARAGARFVLLGALSAELAANKATTVAPATIDSFELIIKGITLRGYSADSDADAFKEWIERLRDWQAGDGIKLPSTIFSGLDSAPAALQEACQGNLRGVVLVAL